MSSGVDVTEERILELYAELRSGNKVAKRLGLWPTQVYSVLNKYKVKLVGWQANPRTNNVTDEQIITAYKELGSGQKVVKALGVCDRTVYNVLSAHGIQTDGLQRYRDSIRKFNAEDKKQIVELYESGLSSIKLAKQYGCVPDTILNVLKEEGISIRQDTTPLSAKEKSMAYTLYAEGKTYKELEQIMGRTERVLCHFINKEHPEIARHKGRKGPESPVWKGGKYVHRGYIMVRVMPDDSMACMQQGKKGAVPEHRLVMALALGRPLTAHETVHHINGNTTDNRLENLQLRKGKHGRGVRMQCLDCSSHNIDFVPLSEPNTEELTVC